MTCFFSDNWFQSVDWSFAVSCREHFMFSSDFDIDFSWSSSRWNAFYSHTSLDFESIVNRNLLV